MSNRYTANLTNHIPSNYSTNASFVYSAKFTQAVLALLDPQPGEHIVDLGCGTGELTRLIAEAVGPEGAVVGIDSSQAMVSKLVQGQYAGHADLLSTAGQSSRIQLSVCTGRQVSPSRYPDTG